MTEINQLISLVGKDKVSNLSELFDKLTTIHEFEFVIFNWDRTKLMSYEKYLIVLNFMKHRSKSIKSNLIFLDTLDVAYTKINRTDKIIDDTSEMSEKVSKDTKDSKSYRITIEKMENINYYIKMLRTKRNHVIFNALSSLIIEGKNTEKSKGLNALYKIKSDANVVDMVDLIIRARLSEEHDLSKEMLKSIGTINKDDMLNVSFRLKQRISLYVHGNETSSSFVRLDLTITNTTKDIKKIQTSIPQYELEIECGIKDKVSSKEKKEIFNNIISEALLLTKVIQQSNYITTTSMNDKVIKYYKTILGLEEKSTSLDARNSFSLEIQHLTEILPNKYAVTDKADGNRNILIIMDNRIYFISTNLVVRDSGIELDSKLSNYNGSMIDGELIFLSKKNRHIFLAFDCLFVGLTDIRKISKLMDRLRKADDIIDNCFIFGSQKNFIFEEYNSKKKNEFNLVDILSFHEHQMIKYMKSLNSNIEIEKGFPLIRRKYFADVYGAKSWELFAYANLMYKMYSENKEVNCPYMLDGLIFQPTDQEYITNTKESKFLDFKWKPPTQNSIDFYIEFEKDKETEKVLTIYDNSIDEYVKNKPYRICNLFVGQKGKTGEQPQLFRKDEELHIAYLFLDKGEVRDLEGVILQDKTVVEFYYNNDPNIDDKFRWVPIRTRNDKTESVVRFRKKYGNYFDVANKVWRSIINPILIADFSELSKGGNTYEKKMESLRNKISHELIVSASKENAYYQLKTNLAKPMRQFHNWIKDVIIYTFCHPMYENEVSQSILDIACGRGGDLMKFYYAKASYYVGLDVDREGLISAVDGAESRYAQMRKSHPNFPNCVFIQADAGALLDVDNQARVFGGMNADNSKKINKFFPKEVDKKIKFDRINCQFAMHYFLKNDDTWKNFKTNLNNHLKVGGYFMITVFDADRIVELLKDNPIYTVNYTNQRGEKKILFEIKRFHDFTQKPYTTGNSIDLHAAWMFKEGQYNTEYLVDRDFIVDDLSKDCDLELVNTDFFDNQYEIHREYFTNYAKYDDNPETRQFLLKVAGFYEHNEINGGCFKYTKLERYYVFRKREGKTTSFSTSSTKVKKTQSGGNKYNLANSSDPIINILKSKSTVIHETGSQTNSYGESLHHLFRSHKLIPEDVTETEFIHDFSLITKDSDMNNETMSKINKNIILDHQITKNTSNTIKKTIQIISGINCIIIEKNCNGEYDVFYNNVSKNENSRTVVMLKNGDNFCPIYNKENMTYRGIFNNDDPFLIELNKYS